MANRTIAYYDENAASFADGTKQADMHLTADLFLRHLPANSLILDFGCGTGRDSLYFIKHGCRVSAIDGSVEMCRMASSFTGLPVRKEAFADFADKDTYNGIWACASILHMPKDDLPDMFTRLADALLNKGVLYVSFKYGDFEGDRDGRYFTDLNEALLRGIVNKVLSLHELAMWISNDVRTDRTQQKWLNALYVKG